MIKIFVFLVHIEFLYIIKIVNYVFCSFVPCFYSYLLFFERIMLVPYSNLSVLYFNQFLLVPVIFMLC